MTPTKTRDIALFIDPTSHHFLNDGLFGTGKASLIGDNILAPYAYLRDWFTSRGVPVHTGDRLAHEQEGAATNIYVSMGYEDHCSVLKRRPDVIMSAFFALECPIVEPSLYQGLAQMQQHFRRVFSFSDGEALKPFLRRPLRCEQFFIPQSYESPHEDIWRQDKRGFLVMINANKLPRLYQQELYTERLRAVEYFSRTGEIDLYGKGWDGPPMRVGKTWVPWIIRRWQENLMHRWHRLRPDPLLAAARRVYRGATTTKAETLGRYTYALCFENMILKGWITEKIFDCFFAGTVPVYWGAPDIEEYVPRDCFIDMRHFASYAELASSLRSLSTKEIQERKECARAYLKSTAFQRFTKQAFVDLFARLVEEDTGVRL